MGSYAKTRSSLSKDMGVEKNLISHFQYKYEDFTYDNDNILKKNFSGKIEKY